MNIGKRAFDKGFEDPNAPKRYQDDVNGRNMAGFNCAKYKWWENDQNNNAELNQNIAACFNHSGDR